MFAQLLASRPVHQRSGTGLVTSVTLHGFLVAGAVYATMGTPRTIDRPQTVNAVYIPDPAPPPPSVPAPSRPPTTTPVVSVPITVPSTLPVIPASLPATPAPIHPSTRFTPGAPPAAPAAHGPPGGPGAAYLAAQVEVPAALVKESPVPRFPAVLRAAGVEGSARFRFVVDTLGRVEPGSVERLTSTHDAFAQAVRDALSRMRFRPARVGGRPVRQLVEIPFDFRISR